MYLQPSVHDVNAKLRAIRLSQSLSLHDVEILSGGGIKAVVLGSYERGARSLSIKRVLQIAKIYQVPIAEIFGERQLQAEARTHRLILDLRLINSRAQQKGRHNLSIYQQLVNLLQRVLRSRQDWNGEIITLRESDLGTLSLILNMDECDVMRWLKDEEIHLVLK